MVGEADLVLLFAEGQLGLAECKQRPVGLSVREVEKFEALADGLDALVTCYAVPAWADHTFVLWRELRRDERHRRAFALTAEHLLQDYWKIMPLLGVKWTAWHQITAAEQAERHRSFVERLPAMIASLNQRFGLEYEVLGGGSART